MPQPRPTVPKRATPNITPAAAEALARITARRQNTVGARASAGVAAKPLSTAGTEGSTKQATGQDPGIPIPVFTFASESSQGGRKRSQKVS